MSSEIDIAYIAELARLELASNQAEKLKRDLETVIGYIDELQELDVSEVEPTAHAVPLTNVWREDIAKTSYPREMMLANAPGVVDEVLIELPKVMPGEGSN